MGSYFGMLAASAAVIAPAVFAAPAPTNAKISNLGATDVIPDSYIVVYNEDVSVDDFTASVSQVNTLAAMPDAGTISSVEATFNFGNFKGMHVAYIEKNQYVYASALTTQTGTTYGLGRISHRAQDATTYVYDSSAGSGVTIFVVDTGILTSHSEFGGRATWGGNFIDSSNTDGNGHGTHCAGTAAGTTYGVAKNANLVAVKVLDANGQGTTASVIAGLQYVQENAPARSVLSMSLGGPPSTATNTAVRAAIAAGITVVVAAGNSNEDASNASPANEPLAITVGSIDNNDRRAASSNYGSVVDVFAPGQDVLSAWIGSNTATRTISGTSMACPHVAGVAAYLIALEGISTPAAVQARIKALGTAGTVTNAGSGSPNLIAYNGNGA